MKKIKLNNGYEIPIIGLGTWKSKPNEVGKAIEYALLEGDYKHIDCAHIYGNEKEIGDSLKNIFSKIKREDVFITSKLWNNSHAKDDVISACKTSLKNLKLQLNYFYQFF